MGSVLSFRGIFELAGDETKGHIDTDRDAYTDGHSHTNRNRNTDPATATRTVTPTATRTPVVDIPDDPISLCANIQLNRQEAAGMGLSILLPCWFVRRRKQ